MARSSVRRDYNSSAKAKRIAIIAGIAVFVLVWIGVVLWLGRMGSAGADRASSEVPAQSTTQEAPAQTTEGAPGAEQDSGTEDERGGSEQREAEESSPEPPPQQGSVPEGAFDPMEEDGGQPEDSGGGDAASESEPSAPEPSESEPSEPQPSAAEIDTTRARTASEQYIVAAYGYTGSDEQEYLSAIEQAASEEIYRSPGGKQLRDYAKAAPKCGMKSTAILEEFEVVGQGAEGLDVTVTFTVEDADGQTHTFRQQQRLSSANGAYEVSGVSVEELISNTTPTESCPGSQANESTDKGSSPDSNGAVADEQQVRSAAGRFIAAAYGYTGNSTEDYRAGVEQTAITEELLGSPGGERIKGYSETAGTDGIKAAAKMEHFEITSNSGEEVEGVAYFDVGRAYGRDGNLRGQTTPYKQELTLKPYEGSYRVSSASAEEEIEGKSATSGPATSGPATTAPADSGERKLTS